MVSQFNIWTSKVHQELPVAWLSTRMRFYVLSELVIFMPVTVLNLTFLAREPPKAIFVLNSDVCGDLPTEEMVSELERFPDAQCLLLTTEATREQSTNFGCVSYLKTVS
jgi:hypothetical protein